MKKTNISGSFVNYIRNDNYGLMQRTIIEMKVWLKAKGLYEQAINDIDDLKMFDINFINKNRGNK